MGRKLFFVTYVLLLTAGVTLGLCFYFAGRSSTLTVTSVAQPFSVDIFCDNPDVTFSVTASLGAPASASPKPSSSSAVSDEELENGQFVATIYVSIASPKPSSDAHWILETNARDADGYRIKNTRNISLGRIFEGDTDNLPIASTVGPGMEVGHFVAQPTMFSKGTLIIRLPTLSQSVLTSPDQKIFTVVEPRTQLGRLFISPSLPPSSNPQITPTSVRISPGPVISNQEFYDPAASLRLAAGEVSRTYYSPKRVESEDKLNIPFVDYQVLVDNPSDPFYAEDSVTWRGSAGLSPFLAATTPSIQDEHVKYNFFSAIAFGFAAAALIALFQLFEPEK